MLEHIRSLNYNVKLAMLWTWVETSSSSMRSGDIFSALVFLQTKSDSYVGYVQGLIGISQMVAAFPAGVAADFHRRDSLLRIASAIGAVSLVLLAVILVLQLPAWTLYLAMCLMGSYMGVYSPAVESVFADSVEKGKSVMYTYRFVIQCVASSMGPLLTVVLFLWLGNTWRTWECRDVVLAGLVMMVPSLLLMCLFDDDKALKHTEHTVKACSSITSLESFDMVDSKGCCSVSCVPRGLMIAGLIFISDLFGALASGMTLKFFSLFFIQKCELRPVSVSLIAVFSPLCISAASILAQRMAHCCGRVTITLITRAIDILLLVSMAFLPTVTSHQRGLLVACHLVRMASANCTRPLMRSVLMDNVPRRHRAKVNALDSVRTFSWSGSAAAGGILIEQFGFETTFLITACIKSLSFLPLILLTSFLQDGPSCCCPPQEDEEQSHPISAQPVSGTLGPLVPPSCGPDACDSLVADNPRDSSLTDPLLGPPTVDGCPR